ncbi:unnamed protein product [Lactuca virosa]|uniref:Uncharacterized protein n=1 Tax=Lactuca virosa TaxID=75947 RepID=A0AAU9N3I2_9ASTR|nr:unnamed protein product [Lactuca virosa]
MKENTPQKNSIAILAVTPSPPCASQLPVATPFYLASPTDPGHRRTEMTGDDQRCNVSLQGRSNCEQSPPSSLRHLSRVFSQLPPVSIEGDVAGDSCVLHQCMC